MHEYLREPCGHEECDESTRLEYCAIEARESEDDIEVLTDVIDTVINELDTLSVTYGYSGSPEHKRLYRECQYDIAPDFETEFDGNIQAGVRVSVEQLCQPMRTVYEVETYWTLAGADSLSSELKRTYTVERYPGGGTHCTVEELDFDPEMTEDPHYRQRTMLPYDFHEVFGALEQLIDLQAAEQR